MNQLNMARVASKLSAKGDFVVANIHDSTSLAGGRLYRVVVSCVEGTKERMGQAIALALKNEASVVADSFRPLPYENTYVGFVVPNTQVRDYNPTVLSTMQELSSNMLMDQADESIWTVQSSGDAKYLCRQSDEDLSELIQTARVRKPGIPSVSQVVASVSGEELEYAAFVDPSKAALRFGFIVETAGTTVTILARDTDKLIKMDKQFIVESADLSGKFEELSSDNKEMMDYYRQVYNYDPKFLKMIENIIKERSSL